MSGNNKVFIQGNLGRDPQMHQTQSGTAICRFSVATNEKYKDRDGNTQEHAEWHLVKCFGRRAEIAGQYLSKGDRVLVWGKLRTDKYTGNDGIERKITEVHAEEFEFLTPRTHGEGANDGRRPAPRAQQPQSRAPATRPAPAQQAAPAAEDDFYEDDIPF